MTETPTMSRLLLSAEGAWLASGAFLLGYELIALRRRERLLSHAVWELEQKRPVTSHIVIFGVGVLLGHFWGPKAPRSS